ncbi:SusF/SusE family outer membrane protein [Salinimicrobium flavum]|uniref:SusF/SusE family outer membrane protein n=1 Tax=Salinimicrobium flavum TaxID=1737065 RepID=A0ABW5J0J8_9FLAO
MKKLSILVIAILALIFNACSTDDDFTFVAKPDPEGISFTNTFLSSYILKPTNANNLGERFVWNEVDMDVQTTVRYELQASIDESFENDELTILGSDIAETNYPVTIAELLSLANDAGLDTDPETEASNLGEVFFRVRAYAGETSATNVEQFSDPVSITLELVEDTNEEVELPKIFVVGNFQAAGGYGNDWTPEDGAALAASALGKTDYEGFVYINADAPEFKFLPTNTGWDGDFGDAGSENGDYTKTLKQEDEVNAGTPDGTGGYFLVKADTEKLTYELTETNWGLIGDATPTLWDADTDMTYDADSMLWTVNLDLIGGKEIKFRANDDWEINLGDTDADGTMEFGGDNIIVPEDGNYTITLDLSHQRHYSYSLTKN